MLPTHRLQHSPYGGPFQPTIREAVRLLSRPPFASADAPTKVNRSLRSPDISDPFSSANHVYTYTTDGTDTFPSPSAYAARQYSWIHIFPEGRVHQHPRKTMRYFKWGIARLILEPDVCPDIVPMWIEGHNEIYPEDRGFPKVLPRIGKQCGVWFGQNVGGETEGVFEDLRRRWRRLVKDKKGKEDKDLEVGVLTDELKYGAEAEALREECTWKMRQKVLEVRRLRGLHDEDPKDGLVETWREEGGKREGKMDDGSLVTDT